MHRALTAHFFVIFSAFALILCGLATPAAAQLATTLATDTATTTPVTLPDPLTKEAIDALVSRLDDAQVRQLLLDQLDAKAAPAAAASQGQSISDFVYHATYGAASSIAYVIGFLPTTFSGQADVFRTFTAKFGVEGWWSIIYATLAGIAAGLAIELLFRRLVLSWFRPPAIFNAPTLRQSMAFLARRLVAEIAVVIVFVLVAGYVGSRLTPRELDPYAGLFFSTMILFPRLAYALSRFLLSPQYPEYRIVHTDDWSAKYLTRHQVGLALVIGLTMLILDFNELVGVETGTLQIGFWLDTGMRVYMIYVCWRCWDGLVTMMRGTDDAVSPSEEFIAQAYPVFAIIVVVALWWINNTIVSYEAFYLFDNRADLITMTLLLMAPAFDTLIRGLVRHFVPPMTGEGPVAERAYWATHASYKRIGRVLVFGVVLYVIAIAWGLNKEMLDNGGAAGRVVNNFFDVSYILATGYLIWELVSLYINRKLAAEMTASGIDPENMDGGGDGGGAGGSRLATVLPLLLNVCKVAILILFSLLALSEMGVDTTPLLAGAGIVGLAVGFGAQKLVSDVVSGIFFLIDDAFRTGEYVEVEGTMGTVEKISVRSMQLRHHRGLVHTIPFGEIKKLTNYSRDWVIMKLKFTVPFGTDPNKVKKIFKKIGAELLEDEVLGPDFLEPFKSQGVLEIDDVGIVIRGKFMAKPGGQWMIRKEIFNRVNAAFAENGIEFARREVRVAIPGLDDAEHMTEEQKSAIAGAASSAVQQQIDQAEAEAQNKP